jgi:ferredoxin-NADP reductase
MPMQVRVRKIVWRAEGINSYELVSPDQAPLPPFTAGGHIDVQIPGGFVRQYSLCNDPRERHRYVIGVLREDSGRGGSRAFHERVRAGDILSISGPRNNFPLANGARRHLLIAGGIGSTPLIAMVWQMLGDDAEFEMHYCARSPERAAFRHQLAAPALKGRVSFHYDGGDPRQGLDLAAVLKHYREGTHLYCCGPAGLMGAVQSAAAHWPAGTVHFEYFAAPRAELSVDTEFRIRIASTGAELPVPPDRTILEVLRGNGVQIESSCAAGVCGTCRTRYLEGEPDHRDFVLTADEQAEYVMVCCSRSRSGLLVLDL